MGTLVVNEILCLSLAVGLARDKIEAPGFLRGRQRSREFRDALLILAAYLLEVHGAKALHAHVFPLSRMALQSLVNLEEHTIRRCIPVLEKTGLIAKLTTLTRRRDANTESKSEGATSDWYCPYQFALGAEFLKLFPAKIGADLAASPLENQCDQDKLTTVERIEFGNTGAIISESLESEGSGRIDTLSSSIEDEALIDGAYKSPQEPQDGVRRVRVSRVRRVASKAPKSCLDAPEAPDAALLAQMRAKYGGEDMTLSSAARAPRNPDRLF